MAVGSERSAVTASLGGGAAGPWDPAAPAGDAPALTELMPWAVPGMRLGREWVRAPAREVLAARWERLAAAEPPERALLFRPSRSRRLDSAVPQLPGRPGATPRLFREVGPCPEPVRIRHRAFDRLWLLPDHRVLDQARPELWRVADCAQLFAVVRSADAEEPGPAVVFSAELPDGHRDRGQGLVLPAYRQPGGQEPNVVPGLVRHLTARLGTEVTAEAFLAYVAAVTAHAAAARSGAQVLVPLTASPDRWAEAVELGEQLLWVHTFGERCCDPQRGRPAGGVRMPGGRRPLVRRAVPAAPSGFPDVLEYDGEGAALLVGEGRIAPVPSTAWEFRSDGARVLPDWFARRCPDPGAAEPGTLEAIRLASWPREWTSELVALATVLALAAELQPLQRALLSAICSGPLVTAGELTRAGVLPAPPHCRRPASVLSHQEEGPEGQFALF